MAKENYIRPIDIKHGIIDMTHGAGGRATAQLIDEVFAKAFRNTYLAQAHDGAVMPALKGEPVMSCDAHVVHPLFFAGGDIGRLAVCGTVNDVAVCGAKPLYLSASFIIEEGLAVKTLVDVVNSMAQAALEAGADDVVTDPEDGSIDVVCDPAAFDAVSKAFEAAGLTPVSSEITMKPLNEVELKGEDAAKMQKLIDALEDLDDVSNVYTSAVFDEE